MSHEHLPTQKDLDIFHQAVEDVVPLNAPLRVTFDPPKPSPHARQRELDETAAIIESLHSPFEIDDLLILAEMNSFLRTGLSRKVLRDLRKGRWAIQSHTDLHGLNRFEAHDEVRRFLNECKQSGKRCVRIVHGRGYGSPGREGVLRQLVKNWLMRRKDVLAFCHAPSNDGGEGALWVLLNSDKA